MENAEVVRTFYQAFQRGDFTSMQQLYGDQATFQDPVFTNLDATEVRAMWEMLISRGKDLRIEFSEINAEGSKVNTEWTATYTFSKTRRKVFNQIRAEFEIEDGKIVKHCDYFTFHKWAAQALGLPGMLFGWTQWLQRKIQRSAQKSLEHFLNSK